ncbi:MAG TPA: hypothetical protein VMV07_13225 [Streptosporangiaceae bacterium]|nr:hypothetical protein [Streptosporangiaceae bacterium]
MSRPTLGMELARWSVASRFLTRRRDGAVKWPGLESPRDSLRLAIPAGIR